MDVTTLADLDAHNTGAGYDATDIRVEQVLAKFASTLALRPINCMVINDSYSQAPAWSDANNIYINKEYFNNTFPQPVELPWIDAINVRGMGLHETAHVLLTPRMGERVVIDVRKNNMWDAFNILEDQRIEMAMTQMFSGVADWLTAIIAQHIINTPQSVAHALELAWGRKFLDKSVRQMLFDNYVKPDQAVRITQLIDEYITLNLADKNVQPRAVEIIKEFHELRQNSKAQAYMQGGWQMSSQACSDPYGHTKRYDNSQNVRSKDTKPLDKKQQQALMEKVLDAVKQDDVDGDGNATDKQSDDSTQAGNATTSQPMDAQDWANKTMQDIQTKHRRSIENTTKQLTGEASASNGSRTETPEMYEHYPSAPSAEAVAAVKSFSRELQLLKSEYEAAWHRGVDRGRLNVQQYMNGAAIDECFDMWDDSTDNAVDLECVIVLDTSSSMSSMFNDTSNAMWAIKRSLDKFGASTTVVTFDHTTHVLYKPTDKADRVSRRMPRQLGDSTEPVDALRYARQVLLSSKRSVKLMIILTDGEWWSPKPSENIIRQLRSQGVTTALGFIEFEPEWRKVYRTDNQEPYAPTAQSVNAHGCEVGVHLTQVNQLHELARAIVRTSIQRFVG